MTCVADYVRFVAAGRICRSLIQFPLKSFGKTHMARITTPSARPISSMSHDPKASFGLMHKAVFRKEGDYWSVGYDGTAIRLKDIRGLVLLCQS